MPEAFVANWHLKGSDARIVSAIVTPLEDKLALVYIDDRVRCEIVPAAEHRYLIRLDGQPVERACASMRRAAKNLGYDPETQHYIGEVDDAVDEHEATGREAGCAPRDAEGVAGEGAGPELRPGGAVDPLPGAGRGSVGEGEPPLTFDDLISEPADQEDIFS